MQAGKRVARSQRKGAAQPGIGLLQWAKRAVAELSKVSSKFEADPVHDLRVAIQRCRSMAEGLRTIDPAPQ
jgi:CHAD domain-containing protein